MATKTVSLLILNPRSGHPQHCVAAQQLKDKELPKVPEGTSEWLKYEVTLEGNTIVMVKTSGHAEAEQVFIEPYQTVGIYGIAIAVGDDTRWKSLNCDRPPVYALLSAMLGHEEHPETDGPFAMNTIGTAPAKANLRLVYAE